MNFSITAPFCVPKNEKGFYLLDHFFSHNHNSQTASQIYAIPWDNGVFFTSRRNPSSSGCVGCLVRRLISTSYHKSASISRVDSVFCFNDIPCSEELMQCAEEVSQWDTNSTKCLLYHFDSRIKEEIHVLPVPGCPCSQHPLPQMPPALAEQWLTKWPNIILEIKDSYSHVKSFHIRSTRLPNSAPLFLQNPQTTLNVGGAPTAADFRDSRGLEMRLIGESFERYSSTFIPQNIQLIENQLIQVSNLFQESKLVPIKDVFSGLYRLFPHRFPPLGSCGVAAHKTLEDAKIAATLELIERDALITAWRVADLDYFSPFFAIPEQVLRCSREFIWAKRLTYEQSHELHILAVKNQFQLPLVLVFSTPNPGVKTSPNFGSGIGFDWPSAIKKALCELLQGIAVPDNDFLDELPLTFVERPRFWKTFRRLELLKRRLHASSEQSFLDFTKKYVLSDLNKSLLKQIFFAELTSSDISLAHWHVVRAICDQFEPFSGSHHREQPNIERVNQFLNHFQVSPTHKMNTDPFPFP